MSIEINESIMNKRILTWVICGLFLSSCSDWLDVMPKESIEEKDLFEESTGFQNALNGVYEQMASTALYGQELTFGMLDVMGQVYFLEGESYYVSSGIRRHHYYYQAGKFQYDANEDIKGAIEGVWSKAYNTIANCNNIINKIETLAPENFRLGEVERGLIKGEAMAARALLHFDLLRLFAPAPGGNTSGVYIPYVSEFPYYGGEAPLTVEETMKRIEKDLLTAKDLIMNYDTLNLAHRYALATSNRFHSSQIGISISEDDSEVVQLPFYNFRGYRINGLAVTALLARFYNYWGGDKHELAAKNAKEVVEFLALPSRGTLAVDYTSGWNMGDNRKFTYDLIFCLSYPTLQTDYTTYTLTSGNAFLTLKYDGIWVYDFADGGDYRFNNLLQAPGESDWYQYYRPLKNVRPASSNDLVKETEDMVPMIRLSEMHFVLAEYYASINDFVHAAENIQKVRVGRNCDGNVDLGITDMETFKRRLLGEVRREYFQEGQTFFYYKKYGEKLTGNMNPDSFVVPIPDSENVN